MPVRTLHPAEMTEVQMVFQEGLDLSHVRISEGNQFPNLIGRIGAFFRGQKPPEANAVTIMNVSYFPRVLKTNEHDPHWLDMSWLIHELTHQWQYQHDGIRYMIEAIFAPTYVYAPPGQSPNDALKVFSKAGRKFRSFNREQQGDIVRDYFRSTKLEGADADRSGWDEYLREVRERVIKKV